MARIVTLLTDFGPTEYVAQVKGTILRTCMDAQIIDLAHDVPPQSIEAAAYLLWSTATHFPPGTIHLAVVDPGVGTARRGLVIECQGGYLVGPDNGLLIPAAHALSPRGAYSIENPALMGPAPSRTFHGRDVFAPVAARLAAGMRPNQVGPAVLDPVELKLFDARVEEAKDKPSVLGRVLHVDRFGNLITNIIYGLLAQANLIPTEPGKGGPHFDVKVGTKSHEVPFVPTYGLAKPQELLATIGGGGLLELAVREGSAADRWAAKVGAEVRLRAA